MSGDFNAVLAGLMQKGGGGGAEFAKIKTGANLLRIYRHPSWAPGQVIYPRIVHWPFGGTNTPCTGPGCEKCSQVEKLKAAGDKDSKDMAYQNRAQLRGVLAAVNVAEPNGIELYELPEATTKNVMAAVASLGGWAGDYPQGNPGEDEKAAETFKAFLAALVEGAPQACGPNGWDLGITYTPKEGKKRANYAVQLLPRIPNKTKVLPFEESEVPDIGEIMDRVAAKKAEK